MELGTYPERDLLFDDSHSGTKTGVKFFDFATDKKVSIANADWSCCGLAVSPDGNQFSSLTARWRIQHHAGEELPLKSS